MMENWNDDIEKSKGQSGRDSRNMKKRTGRIREFACAAIVFAVVVTLVSGCASESAPVYAPAPSTFDRAWSAALAAAQDEGVQIVSEDRVSGIINGRRGDQEVTISMRSQADGNVRVEISQRGPKGSDPGLAGRVSRAYDRRMGR
jgi:hypothetical protein